LSGVDEGEIGEGVNKINEGVVLKVKVGCGHLPGEN